MNVCCILFGPLSCSQFVCESFVHNRIFLWQVSDTAPRRANKTRWLSECHLEGADVALRHRSVAFLLPTRILLGRGLPSIACVTLRCRDQSGDYSKLVQLDRRRGVDWSRADPRRRSKVCKVHILFSRCMLKNINAIPFSVRYNFCRKSRRHVFPPWSKIPRKELRCFIAGCGMEKSKRSALRSFLLSLCVGSMNLRAVIVRHFSICHAALEQSKGRKSISCADFDYFHVSKALFMHSFSFHPLCCLQKSSACRIPSAAP